MAELQPSASQDDETQNQDEKTLEQLVQELNDKMDAQQKAIEALTSKNKGLENEVAKLRGHKIDENEDGEHNKTNGDGNTAHGKFNTITSHNLKERSNPGKSKY